MRNVIRAWTQLGRTAGVGIMSSVFFMSHSLRNFFDTSEIQVVFLFGVVRDFRFLGL